MAQESGNNGQRLWWREETADATTTTGHVIAPSAPIQQAQAAVATKPVISSVLQGPVAEADQFDTLWDELEAEAARRATSVNNEGAATQQAGAFPALTAPLQLATFLRRERDITLRNSRALTIFFGVMATVMIAFFLTELLVEHKMTSSMTVAFVTIVNGLVSQWRGRQEAQKRWNAWQNRDDWRVSVGRSGLTFVTPWTNDGKEETVSWNLIHDIKAVTPPVRGAKDRFFCVERRDGLGFDGKPVTPPLKTAQTGAEKRRRAWRRFFMLESRDPKLPPPVLIPEIALPMSADALVARIAAYEAGQADRL